MGKHEFKAIPLKCAYKPLLDLTLENPQRRTFIPQERMEVLFHGVTSKVLNRLF